MKIAELELSLSRGSEDTYELDMRFAEPDAVADIRRPATIADLDVQRLRALGADVEQQGRELGARLLAEENVRTMLAQALAAVDAAGAGEAAGGVPDTVLRVRLVIEANAAELHRLRWEALRDPDTGEPLFVGERILFSRYIPSGEFRTVRERPRADLRALIAVANPSDLAEYSPDGPQLAPVDVPGEVQRARAGLLGMDTQLLARVGAPAPDGPAPVGPAPDGVPTLDAILSALRRGRDILYLVCHGAVVRGNFRLYLEDHAGSAAPISGQEFVTRLRELRDPPRLVVLASCQSAGAGEAARSNDGGVLAALGPRLAEAGIPAVVAMQGNVSMQTVGEFMPEFFRELAVDGQIDRAISVARGKVREHGDWWVPVLFMRLRSGRLWYVGGFSDDEDARQKLPAFVSAIQNRLCTPIIGPSLAETITGPARDVARRLADEYKFPLALQDREDLPQVSQFISVEQDAGTLLRSYLKTLCERIRVRFPEELPPELRDSPLHELSLEDLAGICKSLFAAAWEARRRRPMADPHDILASLPFTTYVTTTPDDLLARAVAAQQPSREPTVVIPGWSPAATMVPAKRGTPKKLAPDRSRPLIYHLFGHLDAVNSVVLTQDDYFDALMAITSRQLLPSPVRAALSNSALLFLGFRLDDWQFRVLLRFIKSLEGSHLLQGHSHVAVQIDPEEQRFHDPRAARRYLVRYFRRAGNIHVYWGTAEDFLRELKAEYDKARR